MSSSKRSTCSCGSRACPRPTMAASRSASRRSSSTPTDHGRTRGDGSSMPLDRVQAVTSLAGSRSDEELLRAHVDGDRDAFGEIVRRHRDRLWAVALRTLGDREDAADAAQDALLSAYRSAERFRGDSAVTTWLHRIVVNACLDRVRRRQARPTVPLPDATAAIASPSPDRDVALDVRAALAQLSADQRAALVLVDI